MVRWGKEFKDKRDWKLYNEQLVVRGEFYLDLSFRERWKEELGEMNNGKRGGRLRFPNSLMKWIVVWKQFVDYRGLEGIMRKMFCMDLIPEFPDFSTIWDRIHSSTPEISLPQFSEAEIGTDGSGLKTRNAGEYRVIKYGDRDANVNGG